MTCVGMEPGLWRAVNDRVMGGISDSEMVVTEHGLRFQGQLSLENNGGFASIRRPFSCDLENVVGVRLRVCGDGRRYQFRLRLSDRGDGVSWRAVVDTDGSWQTVEIPVEGFVPVLRGQLVASSEPAISGAVSQLGFLVSGGQQGRFRLDIAAIEFLLGRMDIVKRFDLRYAVNDKVDN